MLKSLSLTKSGYIGIGRVYEDRNQCMEQGVRELDYHIEIQAEPEKLNEQGFILDRHRIPEYFDKKYGVVVLELPSCEVIAKETAEDLAEMVGPSCTKVTAIVGGMRAVWERDTQH